MTASQSGGVTDLPEYAVRRSDASLTSSGSEVRIDVGGRMSVVPEILGPAVLNLWSTAHGVFAVSDVLGRSEMESISSSRLPLAYLLRTGAVEPISATLAARKDAPRLIAAAEDAGLAQLQDAERISKLTIVIAGEDCLVASIAHAAEESGVGHVAVVSCQTDDGLRGVVRDADAVIVATRTITSSLAARLNELCHELDAPLVPVITDGLVCSIGPSVLPHQSPCMACYVSRAGPAVVPDDDSDVGGDSQPDPVLSALVTRIAVIESLRLAIQPIRAQTLGRMWSFSLVTLKSESRRVLRSPACPVCEVSTFAPSAIWAPRPQPGDEQAVGL